MDGIRSVQFTLRSLQWEKVPGYADLNRKVGYKKITLDHKGRLPPLEPIATGQDVYNGSFSMFQVTQFSQHAQIKAQLHEPQTFYQSTRASTHMCGWQGDLIRVCMGIIQKGGPFMLLSSGSLGFMWAANEFEAQKVQL